MSRRDAPFGGMQTCATWENIGIADRLYSKAPTAGACLPEAMAEMRLWSLANVELQHDEGAVGPMSTPKYVPCDAILKCAHSELFATGKLRIKSTTAAESIRPTGTMMHLRRRQRRQVWRSWGTPV